MNLHANMEPQFVHSELCVRLFKIGFGVPPIGGTNAGSVFYYENGKLHYDYMPMYSSTAHAGQVIAPLWQQAFDWFEEVHGLSGEVLKQGIHEPFEKPYWWYMIQDDNGLDITDWQKRHGNVLTSAHQDVEGNFVNDELLIKHIFEDKFAFHTRLAARYECLEKLIEEIEKRKS